MDLISWFPGIVALGVSLPFDEILELSRLAMTLVAKYSLHFIFFFSFNKVRWGMREVQSEGWHFMIQR